MTALLVVLPDAQRAPQLLALFNFCLGQLMNLVALQPARISTSLGPRLLARQLFAQRSALVVNFVIIDTVM